MAPERQCFPSPLGWSSVSRARCSDGRDFIAMFSQIADRLFQAEVRTAAFVEQAARDEENGSWIHSERGLLKEGASKRGRFPYLCSCKRRLYAISRFTAR